MLKNHSYLHNFVELEENIGPPPHTKGHSNPSRDMAQKTQDLDLAVTAFGFSNSPSCSKLVSCIQTGRAITGIGPPDEAMTDWGKDPTSSVGI